MQSVEEPPAIAGKPRGVPFAWRRFLSFAAVGGVGVVFSLAMVAVLYTRLGVSFAMSQAIATLCAMVLNFTLNNKFTYRDQALKGRAYGTGLAVFCAVCLAGAAANVFTARWLFQFGMPWTAASMGGIVTGSAWNYFGTALTVWRNADPQR